jgi:hypothetical protein
MFFIKSTIKCQPLYSHCVCMLQRFSYPACLDPGTDILSYQTQAWASHPATHPYQKTSFKFVSTTASWLLAPKTSPSAFPTNRLNTYGRKCGKNKPSESELHNYGRSGNLRTTVNGFQRRARTATITHPCRNVQLLVALFQFSLRSEFAAFDTVFSTKLLNWFVNLLPALRFLFAAVTKLANI